MGLIRKTIMVGTLGAVHGSSKKQRIAKANLKANQQLAENTALANIIASKQAEQTDHQELHPQNIKDDMEFSKLEKLADLKDKGIITQEEFDAKKKNILGL